MRSLLLLFAFCAYAQRYTFVEFDVPGATQTSASAINNSGQIAGTYQSATGMHGFLRAPDGTFTSFDLPGTFFTVAGLNNLGQVAGTFTQANQARGYIRSATGEITTFEIRANGGGAGATAINDRGEIAGTLAAPPDGGPAFVRSADGVVSTFQDFSVGQVAPLAINNRGEIAGWTLIGSSQGTQHGFLRSAEGVVRRFDLPGTTSYTRVAALNHTGQFAGYVSGSSIGYVSNADGSFTLLAGHPVAGLNDSGQVVGSRFDGTTVHGFVGTPSAGSTAPEIRTELPGVRSASAFGGASTIAPGTWIEIYGRNLAPAAREWRTSDFVGDRPPVSLGGVSVTVGGAAAVVSYVSPGQVNALVPASVAAGTAEVRVSNGGAMSAAYPVTVVAWQPALCVLPPDLFQNSVYAAALFPDWMTYALPSSPLFSKVARRPARVGDTLVFFGMGFGAGRVTFAFLGMETVAGKVTFAGPAPGTIGLYQFNVEIPEIPLASGVTGSDFVGIEVKVDGQTVPQGLMLSYSRR